MKRSKAGFTRASLLNKSGRIYPAPLFKNKFTKSGAGFTLIELLVVIAIIGILSSIVIAALNRARVRGQDAKVEAQLSGARNAAGVYYDSNSQSYGIATDNCDNMFADSASSMSTYTDPTNYPAGVNIVCRSDGANYAIDANLPGGNYWCVDSTGAAQSIAADLAAGDTSCN